jgi:hypothetical protein
MTIGVRQGPLWQSPRPGFGWVVTSTVHGRPLSTRSCPGDQRIQFIAVDAVTEPRPG